MASTVQYDAAREPARQMDVKLRPEPFTEKQQRQSRMDGGEEDDGDGRGLFQAWFIPAASTPARGHAG